MVLHTWLSEQLATHFNNNHQGLPHFWIASAEPHQWYNIVCLSVYLGRWKRRWWRWDVFAISTGGKQCGLHHQVQGAGLHHEPIPLAPFSPCTPLITVTEITTYYQLLASQHSTWFLCSIFSGMSTTLTCRDRERDTCRETERGIHVERQREGYM